MANARAKSKKRRKKTGNRARGPAIFLLMAFLGTGIILVAQIGNASDSSPEPIALVTTTLPTDSSPPATSASSDAPASTPSATDPTNLGNPVIVHSDTLGDLDVDQVIDDWTGVEPPRRPDTISQVDPALVDKSYIDGNLPDGYYVGYLVSAVDENEKGFTFDIRSSTDESIPVTSGQQLYPAYLESLIYVSLRTTSLANTAITADKYFELANANTSEFAIPDTDLSALVTGTYMLLTIVDGTVIAVEGIDAF